MSRESERRPVGETRRRHTTASSEGEDSVREYDGICARLYARPDLVARSPCDYSHSAMFVMDDGGVRMVSLWEAAA